MQFKIWQLFRWICRISNIKWSDQGKGSLVAFIPICHHYICISCLCHLEEKGLLRRLYSMPKINLCFLHQFWYVIFFLFWENNTNLSEIQERKMKFCLKTLHTHKGLWFLPIKKDSFYVLRLYELAHIRIHFKTNI